MIYDIHQKPTRLHHVTSSLAILHW